MTKIISGGVNDNGGIYDGEGFEVELTSYGYEITFKTLSKFPHLVAQPWKDYGDATSCQTVASRRDKLALIVQTLDEKGEFKKNAFDFIAVSHE